MSNHEPVGQAALDALFLQARTYNDWQDKEVSDDLLRKIHDIAKMGPTSANCCPMRTVFVRSHEEKEKLISMLDKGNQEKTRKAPVVAIFAYDRKFYEYLPKLFPHTDAKSWFVGKADYIEQTMIRNGTLQAAYFMLAARAEGLDCGPMSGFNVQKVKEAYFPDLDGNVNFICSLGYGDAKSLYPRLPRFDFDEVCKLV